MIKTKKYFGERVLRGLQDAFPNADFKIGEREVFLVIDDIVNAMARDNYLENWKLYGAGLDESFITTWDGANAIAVVDVEGEPSYLTFPAVYAALPMHGGIREIWPINYEFGAVRIMDHSDIRRTRRLMSGRLQGELGGAPKGNVFMFNQEAVGNNYSLTFGMRLVVKDSTALAIDAVFPIPANLAETVIQRAIDVFKVRREGSVADVTRDKIDSVNRN